MYTAEARLLVLMIARKGYVPLGGYGLRCAIPF